MNRNVKYLIIGAGISGLTFANFIKDDYLIIEKENEVGVFLPDDVPDGVKEAFKKAQEIMRQREKEYIESLFE